MRGRTRRQRARPAPAQVTAKTGGGRWDTDTGGRRLHVSQAGCDMIAEARPQALGATYWFDAAPAGGEPYPVTIRFAGRRTGVKGRPGPRDVFAVEERVDNVIPGSGPIAITTRANDIAAGQWHVTATAVAASRAGARPGRPRPAGRARLPGAAGSGVTWFAPIVRVRAPGARLGVWPALVGTGLAAALAVQALLAARAHLSVTATLIVSLTASLAGLADAKIYYLVVNRGAPRGLIVTGLCIQGFVLAAVTVAVAGALATGLPVGGFLDATAPGLLLGMAIGRLGCFFGGCCAGRPTASRWGLWSSDRRLGMRRVPVQLLESAATLVIGLAALLIELAAAPSLAGTVFIGATAAYTLARQPLFPLRDIPRKTSHGRTLTIAASALVLLAAAAAGALA